MNRQTSPLMREAIARKVPAAYGCLILLTSLPVIAPSQATDSGSAPRRRIPLNENWRFHKYDTDAAADDLIYDGRPEIRDSSDDRAADAKPTEAVKVEATPTAHYLHWETRCNGI